MGSLWKRLGEVMGAVFINQFGAAGEDAYFTWSAGLSDMTPAQIKSGFANFMRSDDKFLDLKRFRALCFDLKSYGLPDPELAYREASQHCHEWKRWKFSHAAVAQALLNTSISLMRQGTESQSKPTFLRNYQILCRAVMAGESIDNPIPKAIPAHIPQKASPETAAKHMDQLKGMFA